MLKISRPDAGASRRRMLRIDLSARGEAAVIAIWFLALASIGLFGSTYAGPALVALTIGGLVVLRPWRQTPLE